MDGMQITTESIKEQIPYYLTLEAKDNLIKALDRFPREIDYYLDRYWEELLQGDGWTSVEVIRFDDGARKSVRAILLSNSCDIAPENKRDLPTKLTFAPIIKLNRYLDLLISAGLDHQQIESKTTAIKEQKVTSLFYLPKGANLDDDYVALLDDLHTVPFNAFGSKADRQKLFTLDQVGFYLFLLKLSVHFCRFHEEVSRH
ncbi:hypothetical protein [Thiobacillus sp.]